MIDEENSNIFAQLEEAPAIVDSTSASGMRELYTEEAFSVAMCKVSALEAFTRACTKNSRFEDFTRDILLAIMEVVKSEAGSILEVNINKKCLFFRSVVGSTSDQVTQFSIPLGKGIVGHVAESKFPTVVNDLTNNQDHIKAIGNILNFKVKNLVAIPIVIRAETYGVVELLNRVGEASYTPKDVELLTYLCTMAAKFIELRLMICFVNSQKVKEAA